MKKEIIKKDSRLFLFRIMENCRNKNLMDDGFMEKLKKEGTQMSFAFAKKYYNVVQKAYLRQASHCVLGIMNLGLIESAGKKPDVATNILLKKSYIGIFREGWTLIVDLVYHAENSKRGSFKTTFEWEKDFAESLSAHPGRKWVGYDEYQVNKLTYYSKE